MRLEPAASTRPLRVLALAAYPIRGASTRFRVAQYVEPLRSRGIDVRLITQLDDRSFAGFYRRAGALRKGCRVMAGALRQAVRALPETGWADVVWVQREASLVGPEYLERALTLLGCPLVFDVDDAVWLSPPDHARRHPGWTRRLRSRRKANRLFRVAAEVMAGSSAIAEHAEGIAKRVAVIPTVVSRNVWTPAARECPSEPVIGWVGSHSTAPYLRLLAPVLRELAAEGHRFSFRAVGAGTPFAIEGVDVRCEPFDLEREVDAVRRFDIGVAPMSPGAWTDGKCGCKQLQYMSLAIPCVTSPWAGARDFVRDGENALLCRTPQEWKAALRSLIEDAGRRRRIGAAARALVVERFCAEVQVEQIATVLTRASRTRPGAHGRSLGAHPGPT